MVLRWITPILLVASSTISLGQTRGWPEYGGTLAGQRYSTEKQIQRDNVANLKVAWVLHTHSLDKVPPHSIWMPSFESTPVLWKDTLYVYTPRSAVFAVNAATGEVRWSFDPHVIQPGGTSRGLSLWHARKPKPGVCGSDEVIFATWDRRLMARDATTGQACPYFGNAGTVDLTKGVEIGELVYYNFTSPPTIVGDTIVLGSAIADNQTLFAASGAVRGFDAVTGQQKWLWEPVRWTANQHPKLSGSGNAWSILSADPEHDLVFVPTGSASVDFFGGKRLGDNRDADSIVALQASTGKKVWAFQLVHHNLWDYDTPSQPLLFTFRNKIPAVAVTTKTSMVYVFNRLTGEPLYPIEERPVPASTLRGEVAWPTQPYSTLPSLTPLTYSTADIHLHDPEEQKYCVDTINRLEYRGLFTPPSEKGSLVYPGSLGGANWGSSAFDPTTSVLYTRVSSMPFVVKEIPGAAGHRSLSDRLRDRMRRTLPEWLGGDPPPLSKEFKAPDSGGQEGDESPQFGAPYRLARQGLLTKSGATCGPAPYGSIVAINLDTGKKLWSVAHGVMTPGQPGSIGAGGVIATAGGLLFAASTNDFLIRAYDSGNGKELWQAKLPVAANATPMTYSVKGRQYVVIAAGGHAFIGGTLNDQVIAFALPEGQQKSRPMTKSRTTHSR